MAHGDGDLPWQSNGATVYDQHAGWRPQKPARRESRLGLRGLFSRSKSIKEPNHLKPVRESTVFDPHFPSYGTQPSKYGSVRESVADMTSLSYAHNSDTTLSATPSLNTTPSIYEPPSQLEYPPSHHDAGRDIQSKGELATWMTPPLFKAFSQAVRYVKLPAATMSADSLLRLNDKQQIIFNERREMEPYAGQHGRRGRHGDKEKVKPKRRHRRNTSGSAVYLDWDNKFYVLSTSGTLLQYAGQGDLNRLPEKVLHLGATSAAFASDAIPGRHWVIRVSSCTESDVQHAPESRSLFSKMPFRATDRRIALNFLLVFNSAEEMEVWITVLRLEIEKLGGRKVSETGPSTRDTALLRIQASQPTWSLTSSDRYTDNKTYDIQHEPESEPRPSDCSEALTDPDAAHTVSLDGASTNSALSHDGRQLDSLRESANRLSLLSSSQRTVITSASSSPAPSPIMDSFPPKVSEYQPLAGNSLSEARPRPNASVIASRRQSMQTVAPFVDLTSVPTDSVCTVTQQVDGPISPLWGNPPFTPNFSVPISSNRRFSYVRAATPEVDCSPPPSRDREISPRPFGRKVPPTALRLARPLSVVKDQPSPKTDATITATVQRNFSSPSPTKDQYRGWNQSEVRRQDGTFEDAPSRHSGFMPLAGTHTSPRKQTSLSGLRKTSEAATKCGSSKIQPTEARHVPGSSAPRSPPLSWTGDNNCRLSSVGLAENSWGRSNVNSRATKRSSMYPALESPRRSHNMQDGNGAQFLPRSVPPPTKPLPPIPPSAGNTQLKLDQKARALFNRRSMPQLAANGPPPVPPPTCALPPIPPQKQIRA